MRTLMAFAAVVGLSGPVVADPIQWSTADGGNGHWYEFVLHDGSISWNSAKIAAEESEWPPASGNPGYLATLTSPGENAFIVSIIPSDLWTWLGAYEEPSGTWNWIEDSSGYVEPWGWTNWVPGEPSGDGNYLDMMCYEHTGMWNDEGNPVRRYLVEYTPEPGTLMLLALGGLMVARRRG